jgi:hypothetical protein
MRTTKKRNPLLVDFAFCVLNPVRRLSKISGKVQKIGCTTFFAAGSESPGCAKTEVIVTMTSESHVCLAQVDQLVSAGGDLRGKSFRGTYLAFLVLSLCVLTL